MLICELFKSVPLLSLREVGGHYELREQGAAYNAHLAPEKVLLSTENTYSLDLNVE